MKTQQKAFISLLLCGVIVFWGSQAFAKDWTEAQKEVWKSVEAMWENFKQGDEAAVMALLHDDLVIWPARKRIPWDKYKIRLEWRTWFSGPNKLVSYELEPLSIHILGDVANVYSLFTWGTKKEPRYNNGRAMQTFIKQDNKWLLIGSMGVPAPCPYD